VSVLLVTGAGASRRLGDNGNPLPLMTDWSDGVVRQLGEQNPGLAEKIGLAYGQGEQFEKRIGTFLAWERALAVVEELSALGEVDLGGGERFFPKWVEFGT